MKLDATDPCQRLPPSADYLCQLLLEVKGSPNNPPHPRPLSILGLEE